MSVIFDLLYISSAIMQICLCIIAIQALKTYMRRL